jgi:hypothetical protein
LRNIYFSSKAQKVINRIENLSENGVYIVVNSDNTEHCKSLAVALAAAANKNRSTNNEDYIEAVEDFHKLLDKINKQSNGVIDQVNNDPRKWLTKFDQWLVKDGLDFINNDNDLFSYSKIASLIRSPKLIHGPSNVSGFVTFEPLKGCLFNLDEKFKRVAHYPALAADTLIISSFFQEPLSEGKSFKDFYLQDQNQVNALIENASLASGYFHAYLDRFYADALMKEFVDSESSQTVFLENVQQLLIEFLRNKKFK